MVALHFFCLLQSPVLELFILPQQSVNHIYWYSLVLVDEADFAFKVEPAC